MHLIKFYWSFWNSFPTTMASSASWPSPFLMSSLHTQSIHVTPATCRKCFISIACRLITMPWLACRVQDAYSYAGVWTLHAGIAYIPSLYLSAQLLFPTLSNLCLHCLYPNPNSHFGQNIKLVLWFLSPGISAWQCSKKVLTNHNAVHSCGSPAGSGGTTGIYRPPSSQACFGEMV